MRAKDLTQTGLQEVFEYVDCELWRKEYVDSFGRRFKRKLVKNIDNNGHGYCNVRFKGSNAFYHRIIWILHNGDIPVGMQIDHIDGDKVNNSITNLRLVNPRENSQNRIEHRNGRLVGCYYNKRKHKWHAQIWVNGELKHLGYYSTEQEAHEAYKTALSLEKKRV